MFNGTSRYSADFQQVINRAVAIASLPISALQNDQLKLNDQATALTGIDNDFAALQTAVGQITQAMSGSSFQATVSAPTVASATLGNGAIEGNYSVEVTDVGAFASSMSTASWDSSVGAATYHLTVGTDSTDISVADSQPATLANAINSQFGDKVRATVINVGGSSSPDYRLVLQSAKLGDLTPSLTLDGSDLQTEQTQGRVAQYVVDGSGITVESSTRSVSIATGVTVNLLTSSPGNPVNITVSRSSAAVASALSAFATAYNTAVDDIDKQRGQNAGALSGQAVVSDLSTSLRSLATFLGDNSTLNNLGALGLDLGDDGHLTFNQFTYMAADISNSSGVASFLGSSSSGFLKFATNVLTSVENPTSGSIKSAEKNVQASIADDQTKIADEQSRVDDMQTSLQAQMSTADAAIASMEQQYSYLYNLFQTMQTNASSYK
jgi:flagellar hook-associated protein 2